MTFNYTAADTEVDSSLVGEAYYDDNARSLAVVLDGGYGYVYKNVPRSTYDALVNATSPGAYYNVAVKRKFGPAKSLGYVGFGSSQFRQGYTAPSMGSLGTPKGLSLAPGAKVTSGTSANVPLSQPAPAKPAGLRQHTVVFENGGKTFTHRLHVASVDEAVTAISDLAGALNQPLKVKEVVVSFE